MKIPTYLPRLFFFCRHILYKVFYIFLNVNFYALRSSTLHHMNIIHLYIYDHT